MRDDTLDDEEEVEELKIPLRFDDMVREVEEVFKDFKEDTLYKMGMGGMRQTSIRSLYWKIFLNTVSTPSENSKMGETLGKWESEIDASRKRFSEMQKKHEVNICKDVSDDDEEALAIENPLSDHKDTSWAKYFKQNQIEREINKDLSRMSADDDRLYERPDVRTTMLTVLRLFSLENSDTGYRQGMHDVLSSFIYFMYFEANSITSASPEQIKSCSPETLDLLEAMIPTEQEDIIADAYILFEYIMNDPSTSIKTWYKVVGRGSQGDTPIVKLCNRLQDEILPKFDPKLAAHLKSHSIQPTVYALRWFRVWFIREFDVSGSAPLWDAVFTEVLYRRMKKITKSSVQVEDESSPLEYGIFPMIGAAMLHYLSEDLQERDFSSTLKRLMKYPPVENISVFVERAVEWSDSPLANYLPVSQLPSPPKAAPKPVNPSPLLPKPAVKPAVAGPEETFPAASATASVSHYQRKLEELTRSQKEMGNQLQTVISAFETKWFERDGSVTPEQKEKQQDEYILAIAELKRIKDTLSGAIAMEPAPPTRPPFPPLSVR
eukprot:TRINITY_DN10230_c0_g2_i1.p1 TRINITY_DN10230_c0_g2~~TRINITY_DN10230_c0_g2_i1.p1  ORF type:complete len:573 (+),score=95.43 TRINITY_DN10230_c0_g2_i1:73-1719(+)